MNVRNPFEICTVRRAREMVRQMSRHGHICGVYRKLCTLEKNARVAAPAAKSCTSRSHAYRQPPYEVAVRLAVARHVANHLDPRKALDEEAQSFFQLDERNRPPEAQVTPEPKLRIGRGRSRWMRNWYGTSNTAGS